MTLPGRVNSGERLTADAVNRSNEILAKFEKLRGSAGVKVAITPGGASIGGAVSSRGLVEPATAVLAANESDVTLPAYAPCGLSGHLLTGAKAQSQRVVLVRLATDDDAGRFAITAEPIAPGRIGRVYVMGVCLCRLINEGEGDENRFAEVATDSDALIAGTEGGAQIIWEETFEGDEVHLGLVRFPHGGTSADFEVADAATTNATALSGIKVIDNTANFNGAKILARHHGAASGLYEMRAGDWKLLGTPKIVVARAGLKWAGVGFYLDGTAYGAMKGVWR